jgi:hypothetical protein fuD12_05863
MLNCEYCGNVIEGDEKFYIIDDEYYCKDCVVEEQRVVYKVCDEDYYDEDDVVEYESSDEYINTLNNLIKFCDEAIETNNKLLDDLDDEKKIKYLNFANSIHKENKIKYEKELENFKNLLKENIDK